MADALPEPFYQFRFDWDAFDAEFAGESDRAVAITGAAALDTCMRDLLASFMIDDQRNVDVLLGTDDDPERPLGTLGSRARAAYCLGLIYEGQFHDLRLISKMRNRFAHRVGGISFDEEPLVSWCRESRVLTFKRASDALLTAGRPAPPAARVLYQAETSVMLKLLQHQICVAAAEQRTRFVDFC